MLSGNFAITTKVRGFILPQPSRFSKRTQ